MSLLDSNFVKMKKLPAPKHTRKDYLHGFVDDSIWELADKEGTIFGKLIIPLSTKENVPIQILNSDDSLFLKIHLKEGNIKGIRGTIIEDSNAHKIAEMKVIGKIKPHYVLENPNEEEIMVTKGKKEILDKESNTVASIDVESSWVDLLYARDRPWELRISNQKFDKLLLLGLFFSIFLHNFFDVGGGTGG